MTKTTNFQLNQWAASDPIRRTDFNADNAAIDAAIKAVEQNAANALAAYKSTNDTAVSQVAASVGAQIVAGTYTGNATSATSFQATQAINLGFQPRFLLVWDTTYNGTTASNAEWTNKNFAVAMPGCGHHVYVNYTLVVEVTSTGFTVGGVNGYFNYTGNKYGYLAIR